MSEYKNDSVLRSAIEATEHNTRSSSIDEVRNNIVAAIRRDNEKHIEVNNLNIREKNKPEFNNMNKIETTKGER